MPSVALKPVDDALRRNDFKRSTPSVRRAKARYKHNSNLSAFESEVEAALASDTTCTVCGRNSIADDGRCKKHTSTSLSGDWPTKSDLQLMKQFG